MDQKERRYWELQKEMLEDAIAGIEKQDEKTQFFKKDYTEFLKSELEKVNNKLKKEKAK